MSHHLDRVEIEEAELLAAGAMRRTNADRFSRLIEKGNCKWIACITDDCNGSTVHILKKGQHVLSVYLDRDNAKHHWGKLS